MPKARKQKTFAEKRQDHLNDWRKRNNDFLAKHIVNTPLGIPGF